MRRYLEEPITSDLSRKMVFLAGPRQVGKTTLARRILADSGPGTYLNWDNRADRKEIRNAVWPGGEALVVLDELRKWRQWKGWIKGEYDKHGDRLRFLITGSARMGLYRRGGDSLQGRYHHYRLHPLSCAEVEGVPRSVGLDPAEELPIPAEGTPETVAALMQFGGFPEPFLAQSRRTHRRWQKERLDLFFREDVRDLSAVRDLASMQILADLLPERVGSPLSLNSLSEDLEVSHRAVTNWMAILERLYFAFRLRPFTAKPIRGLRKMTKAYLWDSSMVGAPGPRFENLVALHLLKLCHFLEDQEGFRVELRYLRDRAGREVDFLVTVDGRPWFAVEARTSEGEIESALFYFRRRLRIPWAYQVVLRGSRDVVQDGVRVVPAHLFFGALA